MFPFRRWFSREAPKVDALAQSLRQSVGLAFRLSRRSGRPVGLALQARPGCLVPRLPRHTGLGLPEGVPPPEGMLDVRWVREVNPLRVSPWATATEGMWFFRDPRGPLCMHLTARGGLHLLRYEPAQGWREA